MSNSDTIPTRTPFREVSEVSLSSLLLSRILEIFWKLMQFESFISSPSMISKGFNIVLFYLLKRVLRSLVDRAIGPITSLDEEYRIWSYLESLPYDGFIEYRPVQCAG